MWFLRRVSGSTKKTNKEDLAQASAEQSLIKTIRKRAAFIRGVIF